MIKALLLIFEPCATWDKIAQARRSFLFVFAAYLTPMIVLSVAAEIAGLHLLGRRDEFSGDIRQIPQRLLIHYGLAQLVLGFAFVLIGARVMRGLGDTFHSRHKFPDCFRLVAYAFSPVFLIRMLDGFPWMNPWASLAIGLVLAWSLLYPGVPRLLEPDPPQAFGLYLSSGVTITVIAGLCRFVGILILTEKIKFLR